MRCDLFTVNSSNWEIKCFNVEKVKESERLILMSIQCYKYRRISAKGRAKQDRTEINFLAFLTRTATSTIYWALLVELSTTSATRCLDSGVWCAEWSKELGRPLRLPNPAMSFDPCKRVFPSVCAALPQPKKSRSNRHNKDNQVKQLENYQIIMLQTKGEIVLQL